MSFNSIEVVIPGMGILGKSKGDVPGGEFRKMRAGGGHSSPKETPKDTSVFGGKPSLSRGGLREQLRRASPVIPGSGGRILGGKERVGLEKKVWGRRYGSQIDQKDWEKGIKILEKTERKAPTQAERVKIREEVKILKRLGGKS